MIGLIIFLIVVGVILYFLPMDAAVKSLVYKVIAVVVCLLLLVWILGYLGVWHPGERIHSP